MPMSPRDKAMERRRNEILALVKITLGCKRCGYDESPAALQFHHREGEEKAFNIGACKRLAWERVRAEVKKCDVLCGNCHMVETYGEPW